MDVAVPAGSVAASTLRGHLGAELREVDYLNLCCVTTAGPFDAAACAVAVEPAAAGCASLPAAVARKLARARERIAEAVADPAAARKPLRKAVRLAGKVRRLGQRIARRDDCGFALGLMASHALETFEPPPPATGSAAGSPSVR
jgi:hypothetical protein